MMKWTKPLEQVLWADENRRIPMWKREKRGERRNRARHHQLLSSGELACSQPGAGWDYKTCSEPRGSLQNDLLTVEVTQLSSVKTQVPYSYYSLPFCRPDTIVNSAGSLGELLRGDRIESSPYVVILQDFGS